MNTIRNVRELYNLSNAELSRSLKVSPTSIPIMLDREVNTLTLKQLTSLHEAINVPYNILLGARVFTINNIDSNDISSSAVNVLDNDNDYLRLLNRLRSDLKDNASK